MGAPGARDDAAALAARLARWRRHYEGRPLFRAAAGPRWVRLHLAGDERPCLLLATGPGPALLALHEGRLPGPLADALAADRDHPLPSLLAGATLTGLGVLPGERVACLRLARPDGSPMHLLHQLFGSPGNTALLDGGGRCLWAARRPPHPLLSVVPARATYAVARASGQTTTSGDEDDSLVVGDSAILDGFAAALAAELKAQAAADLGRRLRAAEKLAARRSAELAAAGTGDEHRRRAEALAACLHTVRQGMSRCEVTDPRDGQSLEIGLDPALGPAANLDALFHRARKAERGREVIAEGLASAQERVASLRRAQAGLDALPAGDDGGGNLAAAQAWLAAQAAATAATDPGGATARPQRRDDEASRPFRRYLVDGRWEVWVGRSSRENDELTHRAAHARDLWFHAHGAAGSHVVLRTRGRPEDVPRGVVQKAAALAALHSKARHASLAPVIWTERRYVRKPRKAPPGQAVTLQAHTLMVEPGIAPGVEPA